MVRGCVAGTDGCVRESWVSCGVRFTADPLGMCGLPRVGAEAALARALHTGYTCLFSPVNFHLPAILYDLDRCAIFGFMIMYIVLCL